MIGNEFQAWVSSREKAIGRMFTSEERELAWLAWSSGWTAGLEESLAATREKF